jgi:hypothetical protein
MGASRACSQKTILSELENQQNIKEKFWLKKSKKKFSSGFLV